VLLILIPRTRKDYLNIEKKRREKKKKLKELFSKGNSTMSVFYALSRDLQVFSNY
jgi:hypothetical protein